MVREIGRGLAVSFVVVTQLLGCATYDEPDFPEIPPEPPPVVRDVGQPPSGSLWRQDVVSVVDAGLGNFLGKVRVEAALERGQFTGFRILELRPAQFWAGVDLKPGDVVTGVNGMPIQRDTEAYAAFQALKEAPELQVNLVRDGVERQLSYRIVDRPETKTIPATAPQGT